MTITLPNPYKQAAILARTWPAYGPFPDAPYPLAPLHAPLEVMDNPPTVTVGSGGGASVISGSTLVGMGDPRLAYVGNYAIVGSGFPNSNYVSPTFSAAAGDIHASGPFGVEFDYDGSEFELYIKGGGSTNRYRLTVLGEGYESQAGHAGPTADGNSYKIHYEFGSAEDRHIRFDFAGETAFGGIYIAPGSTLTEPTTIYRPKVIYMGDSFTEGTGANASFSSFVDTLSQMTGWHDTTASGWGGTGVLNDASGTKETYAGRVQEDVIDREPSIVIVGLSGNDSGLYVEATYETALDSLLDTIEAGLPDATIILDGPWWKSGSPTATMLQMNQSAREVAAAHGIVHIDQYGGPSPYDGTPAHYVNTGWITGTGKDGSPVGDGNADLYTAADGTHPTQAGHDYRGEKLAIALLNAAPGLFAEGAFPEPPPPPVLTYAETVMATTGLIGYWRFGEPSGTTAADETANNYDATSANVTHGAAGAISGDSDTAYTFNGTTAKVTVTPTLLHASEYSMECWCYPTKAHNAGVLNGILMSRGVGGGSTVDTIGIMGTLFDPADEGVIYMSNESGWELGTTVLTLNTWHHVVATRDSSANIKVYVDGVLEITAALANLFSGSDLLTIGARSDNDWWFQGRIDEAAVYNGVLSAGDVSDHYDAGAGVLP